MVRLVIWVLFGCFGCIVSSILVVILKGEVVGLLYLKALIQSYVLSFRVNFPILNNNYHIQSWGELSAYMNASLIGFKLCFIRLYVLLHWFALLLLFGFVGLIDGLAQRKIRRLSAGRESALLYHQIKPFVLLALVLGLFFELVLPISMLHAEWLWMASVFTFGFAIQLTAKHFKKYL